MRDWKIIMDQTEKEFNEKSQNISSTPEKKPEPIEGVTLSVPDKTLLSMPLPIVNPFLFGQAKATMDAQIKRGRIAEDSEVQVKYLVPTPLTPLQTAGEAGVFETSVETARDVTTARSTAAILYARYHVVDDCTVARCLVPARLQGQADATRSLMFQINRDCDRYHTKIMAFYSLELLQQWEAWIFGTR